MTSLVLGEPCGRKVPARSLEPAGPPACLGSLLYASLREGFSRAVFIPALQAAAGSTGVPGPRRKGGHPQVPPVLQLPCDPVNCDTRGRCWARARCIYMPWSACILRWQAWFIWMFLFSARSFFLTKWKKSLILFSTSLFACCFFTHSKENKREDWGGKRKIQRGV